ncbi:MAG: PKD domain-containing protein, partial [Candidatus Thermoplasmatota archaeon]|nr:PKD domain-containing protein [Candidatus Thermoplasmatota archaeon]
YSYPNCGFSGGATAYPTATVDVTAALISEPPTIRIDSTSTIDRDLNGSPDTVNLTSIVNSTAFFEILDITVHAFKDNILYDTIEYEVAAGNGIEVESSIFFTVPEDGNWVFDVELRNYGQTLVDEAISAPVSLTNMKPVAVSNAASNATQTYLGLQFYGAGYDEWGFSTDNETFSQNETPVAYSWDFGDGTFSGLKNPIHEWILSSNYTVESRIEDRGGALSEPVIMNISVNDTSDPIVGLTVQGVDIKQGLSLRTNERVLFNARSTEDNVPDEELLFTWDFGDGRIVSGVGLVEIDHAWLVGTADGMLNVLNLTVSDGVHIAHLEVNITILNRPPRLIFDEGLETYTLTPLTMPMIFIDDDGVIQNVTWSFNETVNLQGGILNQLSPFTESSSEEVTPSVAWRTPGIKIINLSVTDDDGNTSTTSITVTVM